MANNNVVKLTGNLGAQPKVIEGEKKFAVFSLATTDSYKDKTTDQWKDRETVWHNVITFNPTLIEKVKNFMKGTRVEVNGYISYRPFEVKEGEGKTITKKEASVVAFKIDEAPLVKKTAEAEHTEALAENTKATKAKTSNTKGRAR